MTDTPTTPRKNAPGQGRKKKAVPGRRFLLPIWCTPDEYAAILDKHKTTEGRAVVLLNDEGGE